MFKPYNELSLADFLKSDVVAGRPEDDVTRSKHSRGTMPCSSLPLTHKAHPSSNSCMIWMVSPFVIGSSSGNEGMNLDVTIAELDEGTVPWPIPVLAVLFHDALGIVRGVTTVDWLNCMAGDGGASLDVPETGSKLASRGRLIHVDTRERRRCIKRFRSRTRATTTSTRITAMTMPTMAPAGRVCLDTAPFCCTSDAEADVEAMTDTDGNGGIEVVDDSDEDDPTEVDSAIDEPKEEEEGSEVEDSKEVDDEDLLVAVVVIVVRDTSLDAAEDNDLVMVIVVIGTVLVAFPSCSSRTEICGSCAHFR